MAGYLGYRPNYDIISDNSIDSDQYVDGSIDLAHMSVNSIDSDQYVDASIDLAHMSVNSIDSDQYVDGSIDDAHLATGISASKLTGSLPALTLAGALTGADQIVTSVNLKDYGVVTVAKGNLGATPAFDIADGNHQTGTNNQTITSSTFVNPTASDEYCAFILSLTNGQAFSITWPTSVDWEGGTAPTLTASGLDLLGFYTYDGGTIWHGMLLSTDSS